MLLWLIIINNKEKEYAEVFSNWNGTSQIIDMVRLDGQIQNNPGYHGINW